MAQRAAEEHGNNLLHVGLKHLRRNSSRQPGQSLSAAHGQTADTETRKAPSPDNSKANGSVDQTEQQSDSSPLAPPDGGRIAWTQVLASFLINMNVYGLVNAFGEFQHFYETEFLVSYSSSTISWIGTVQGALTLFVGAVAGPIFDKGYLMIVSKLWIAPSTALRQ